MIATVSNYSIDLEHLEAIYMDERGGDWGVLCDTCLETHHAICEEPRNK